MKYTEMNAKQKKAYKNIKYCAFQLTGELENATLDYSEDSEDYKYAKSRLEDHDWLVKECYDRSLEGVYDEGMNWYGARAEQYIKDIKFCGKEFLMEVCEYWIKKNGY